MNVNEVIKYPILSEKTYAQMQNGVYTFAVDRRSNKVEIRKTIEFIFEVHVQSINIINSDRKPKRLGRFQGFTSAVKKAIVTLKNGERINIFPEEANALGGVENKVKQSSEEKVKPSAVDAEKSAAIEAKVAAKLASVAEAKPIEAEVVEKPISEEVSPASTETNEDKAK